MKILIQIPIQILLKSMKIKESQGSSRPRQRLRWRGPPAGRRSRCHPQRPQSGEEGRCPQWNFSNLYGSSELFTGIYNRIVPGFHQETWGPAGSWEVLRSPRKAEEVPRKSKQVIGSHSALNYLISNLQGRSKLIVSLCF